MVGAFLVVGILASGAHGQTSFQVASEEEKKPLITPPKLIRFVEAAYPETEGDVPVEAVVELDLVVGKDGLVTEASVARSAGEGFDAAALAAGLPPMKRIRNSLSDLVPKRTTLGPFTSGNSASTSRIFPSSA